MSSLHEVMQQITKCRKAGEVSYSNFYPGESMDTEYQMTACFKDGMDDQEPDAEMCAIFS